MDAYSVKTQRGLSDNDVRHKLAFNFVLPLPRLQSAAAPVRAVIGGWELSGLATLQTGLPAWAHTTASFSPIWNNASCSSAVTAGCRIIGNSGGDYNADGYNFDVPNAPAFSSGKSYSRSQFLSGVFTAADFPVPSLGQEGDLGRNTYRGPGLAQIDASILKNFPLPFREGMKLQFRAEAYNVFNRVNLTGFDTDMASGTFGQATSTFTPRTFQFAARVEF